MPGRPASVEVGISGAALIRAAELTDRIRTLPARARSRICAVALAANIGGCQHFRVGWSRRNSRNSVGPFSSLLSGAPARRAMPRDQRAGRSCGQPSQLPFVYQSFCRAAFRPRSTAARHSWTIGSRSLSRANLYLAFVASYLLVMTSGTPSCWANATHSAGTATGKVTFAIAGAAVMTASATSNARNRKQPSHFICASLMTHTPRYRVPRGAGGLNGDDPTARRCVGERSVDRSVPQTARN